MPIRSFHASPFRSFVRSPLKARNYEQSPPSDTRRGSVVILANWVGFTPIRPFGDPVNADFKFLKARLVVAVRTEATQVVTWTVTEDTFPRWGYLQSPDSTRLEDASHIHNGQVDSPSGDELTFIAGTRAQPVVFTTISETVVQACRSSFAGPNLIAIECTTLTLTDQIPLSSTIGILRNTISNLEFPDGGPLNFENTPDGPLVEPEVDGQDAPHSTYAVASDGTIEFLGERLVFDFGTVRQEQGGGDFVIIPYARSFPGHWADLTRNVVERIYAAPLFDQRPGHSVAGQYVTSGSIHRAEIVRRRVLVERSEVSRSGFSTGVVQYPEYPPSFRNVGFTEGACQRITPPVNSIYTQEPPELTLTSLEPGQSQFAAIQTHFSAPRRFFLNDGSIGVTPPETPALATSC